MYASFNRFEIKMTYKQAAAASHPGPCDYDVKELCHNKNISRQLDKINPDKIRDELWEYGAWDDTELMDNVENRERIIWIAAGDITDEYYPNGRMIK